MLIECSYIDNAINYNEKMFTFCETTTGKMIKDLLQYTNIDKIGCIRCYVNEEDVIVQTAINQNKVNFILENTKTIIGSQIELVLLGFNNNEAIVAKVDTGASFCSLHAENIQTGAAPYGDKQTVTFSYKDVTYRMPIVNQQSVQNSDGGISYRPVVKFNVVMNNKTYEDVLFNLNDRSDMTHDILLGQNLLAQSRVLVDPTLYMESLQNDFDTLLNEVHTDVIIEAKEDKKEKTEKFNDDGFERFKNLTLREVINQLEVFNS